MSNNTDQREIRWLGDNVSNARVGGKAGEKGLISSSLFPNAPVCCHYSRKKITISHNCALPPKCLLKTTEKTRLPKTHNLTLQEPERSHKGLCRFMWVSQRPVPKESLETYCIFSPLTLTWHKILTSLFDFKVHRSDSGNFSMETNQRHLEKKSTYVSWNARAHGRHTKCWREREMCYRSKQECMSSTPKWASERPCYFLKDTKWLKQIKKGRIETGSILASVGKELIWNSPKGQKYHDSHSCQSSS